VAPWPTGFVGFDLETTGTDPAADRIVSAACVRMRDGVRESVRNWLVDPGIPIPASASAVHGITDERVRHEGMPSALAVPQIVDELHGAWARGDAVVIYNASFDFPLIVNEAQRHATTVNLDGLILDPLVLWRHFERYRPGKRRLSDAVEAFGVELVDAHDATADATAAVEVMQALLTWQELREQPVDQLMNLQQQWHREWAESFQAWGQTRGLDFSDVRLTWPL